MFEFVQRYISEHRKAPLIREIQSGCEITSYKSALDRLNALERKRFIKRTPNKHRGIKLLRRAVEFQVPAERVLVASVPAGPPSLPPVPEAA